MFSHTELGAIVTWARVGQELLTSQIQCSVFTQQEIVEKRKERALLEAVIIESEYVQNKYAHVDADHMGSLISVCNRYGEYVKSLYALGKRTLAAYMEDVYMVGYLRGKIELGLLEPMELELLAEWEILVG